MKTLTAGNRGWCAKAVHTKKPNGVSRCDAARRGRHSRVYCVQSYTENGAAVANSTVPIHQQFFSDANFPVDAEGRTYHIGTKKGEVANRVLTVGCAKRGAMLAGLLEPLPQESEVFHHESKRGFVTFTGLFQGTPVSIVAAMMGMANMDFAVRETQAVVEGPLAMIRLGSCGAVQPPAALGNLVVASRGSTCIRRNPDAFDDSNGCAPYIFHRSVPADEQLSQLIVEEARKQFGGKGVVEGMNATADSFYSSQGRLSGVFDDRNDSLIDDLVAQFPNVLSLEMETFHLLDLARSSKGLIVASAACLALAERYTNEFIDMGEVGPLEKLGGLACLSALTRFRFSPTLVLGDLGI